jgi:hypothetical protein
MSAPIPKPEKPKSDNWLQQFWRDHQAVATIISAFIGAIVVIGVAALFRPIVNVFTGLPPSPTTTSPATPVPPPNPTRTPTPTPTPDPTSTVTERRSTGEHPLALSQSYSADLDSMNPGWDVKYAATASRFDIGYAREGWLSGRSSSDLAIVSGEASYDVCSTATSYRKSLDRDEVKKGINLCVRTSEKRYAFMTIKKLVGGDYPSEIQLDVVVWNPPFEE